MSTPTDETRDSGGYQATCDEHETTWYGPARINRHRAATDAQAHDYEEHDGEIPVAGIDTKDVVGAEAPSPFRILPDGGEETVIIAAGREVYHTDPDCQFLKSAKTTRKVPLASVTIDECRVCAGTAERNDTQDHSLNSRLHELAESDEEITVTDGGIQRPPFVGPDVEVVECHFCHETWPPEAVDGFDLSDEDEYYPRMVPVCPEHAAGGCR